MSKFNKTVLTFLILVMLVGCGLPFALAKDEKAPTGKDVVSFAKKYEGYPYSYGSSGPNSFDCSGFVRFVFSHFGAVPPSGISYFNDPTGMGRVVSEAAAKPGDIIAWSGHVGIYIGNGKVIHALNSRYGVCISNIATFRNRHGVSNPAHVYIRAELSSAAEAEKKDEPSPAKLKKSFFAYVRLAGNEKMTAADVNGNIALKKGEEQLWLFSKAKDGSYTISNCLTGAHWATKASKEGEGLNLVAVGKTNSKEQGFEILGKSEKCFFRSGNSDMFIGREKPGNNLSESSDSFKKAVAFELEIVENGLNRIDSQALDPAPLTVHPLLKDSAEPGIVPIGDTAETREADKELRSIV